MAAPANELHGSCACDRNQYTIVVPQASNSQASVFFDNSAANRRSQATPLTAWLRIPLAWYHSRTFALFPDETHGSIRRTFHTPTPGHRAAQGDGDGGVTRRQFCGYCGTHLSAFDEGQGEVEEWMDVTLGSLGEESLRALEVMGVLEDSEEDGEDESVEDALEEDYEGAEVPEVVMSNAMATAGPTGAEAVGRRASAQPPQLMRNRGMPFFESMVENSRLGRIKRQKGGHTSRDGRTTVRWEVVEIDGDGGQDVGGDTVEERGERNKRPRLEP